MGKFRTEQHVRDFDSDLFDYGALSKKILDGVILEMDAPNCLGIYGNWGSGKSTVLHFIQQHIKQDSNKYKHIVPVYFEPWKYEYAKEGDLLFALLRKIQLALGTPDSTQKETISNIFTTGTFLSRRFLGIDLKEIKDDMSMWDKMIYSEYEAWVDGVERFQEEFRKLVQQGLKQHGDSSFLLVFIDDLDRCLPENTVRLLESIKNFLSVAGVIFVVAIDNRIVSEMIEAKYKLHQGYGDEYLMKIIHYYIELPRGDVSLFTNDILASYGIPVTTEDTKTISIFLKRVIREPRRSKHYLHQFGMRMGLANNKSIRDFLAASTSNPSIMVHCFIICYLMSRYPEVFRGEDVHQRLTKLFNCSSLAPEDRDYEKYARQLDSMPSGDRKAIESILRLGDRRSALNLNLEHLYTAHRLLSETLPTP